MADVWARTGGCWGRQRILSIALMEAYGTHITKPQQKLRAAPFGSYMEPHSSGHLAFFINVPEGRGPPTFSISLLGTLDNVYSHLGTLETRWPSAGMCYPGQSQYIASAAQLQDGEGGAAPPNLIVVERR